MLKIGTLQGPFKGQSLGLWDAQAQVRLSLKRLSVKAEEAERIRVIQSGPLDRTGEALTPKMEFCGVQEHSGRRRYSRLMS